MGYIFNGISKTITLTTGTTSVSVRDLWSRWVDWFLTGDNSKFLPAFKNVGGDDIDLAQGTKIPIYSFLENGWKIKPQEANHTLTINDGILLVNGGGDPFINTDGAYTVRINYQQPVQAISFSTGGGGGGIAPTVEQIRQEMDTNSQIASKVDELHQLQGAKVGEAMTVDTNNGTRSVGTIVLEIDSPTEGVTIVTRQ